MPAVMRLTDSELILGTMTPMSLVEPVRSARAWLDRTYPVNSIACLMRSALSAEIYPPLR